MGNQLIDWDFEQVSSDGFKCVLELDIDNKILMQIFNAAKSKLSEQRGISVQSSPDVIEAFDVEPRYLNVLKTCLGSNLKKVYADVRSDGIVILNDRADKGTFKRVDASKWRFVFVVTGQFCKKCV